MTEYNLIKLDGTYWVENLPSLFRPRPHPHTLLFVRNTEGDMDTIHEVNDKMHEALYNLRQMHDGLKDGDVFLVDGIPVFKVHGVHVIPAED